MTVRDVSELRRLVGPLFGGGTGGERLGADRRVRVEHFLLLFVGEARRDLARTSERIFELGEALDEARAALEQVRQLLDAQLPR